MSEPLEASRIEHGATGHGGGGGHAAPSAARDVGEAHLVVPSDGAAGARADAWGLPSFIDGVPWVVIVAAGLALVGVLGAVSWLGVAGVSRRIEQRDPAEAAFRGMCRGLGVSGAQRRVLREAAAVLGCEPVALLLSESMLERALAAATPKTLGPLEVVRRKL